MRRQGALWGIYLVTVGAGYSGSSICQYFGEVRWLAKIRATGPVWPASGRICLAGFSYVAQACGIRRNWGWRSAGEANMLGKPGLKQQLALAAAVLLGLAAVIFLALKGGRGWPSGGFNLEITFPTVRGLEVGARVRVLGVQAGEVTRIRIENNQVVVGVRLEQDFSRVLRSDAQPRIISEGLVGGQALEIVPGTASESIEAGASLAGVPPPDWEKSLEQLTDLAPRLGRRMEASLTGLDDLTLAARKSLENINGGQGSLGKLATDTRLYDQLVGLAAQGQDTMLAIRRDAEAMQSVPLFGSLVRNPDRLLIRPECKARSWWFPEGDLFEPGTAILTPEGRKKLVPVGTELAKETDGNSEVVLAGYCQSTAGLSSQVLSERQATAVMEHMRREFVIQKTGWFSWRRVSALGMGDQPPPGGQKPLGPAPRLEIWLFVPGK